jgi:hypothetical protein
MHTCWSFYQVASPNLAECSSLWLNVEIREFIKKCLFNRGLIVFGISMFHLRLQFMFC